MLAYQTKSSCTPISIILVLGQKDITVMLLKHNVSMSGLSFYKILSIYLKTLSWLIQREAIDTRKSNLASYIKIAFNCICFLQRCFNECMLA